jgi:hypothetical protein
MEILKIIERYDEERESYIRHLEAENERLRVEKAEAIQLAVRGVQIHESSMLKLVLSGALSKPNADDGDKLTELRPTASRSCSRTKTSGDPP